MKETEGLTIPPHNNKNMTQTVITITEDEMISIQKRAMQRIRLRTYQTIARLDKEIKFAK